MNKEIVIKYKPFAHQKKFHNSNAYERLMISGFGGGKTMAGASETIALAFENYGLSSLVVTLTYPIARRTVIPTLKQILDSSKINYTFRISEFVFIIHDAMDHRIMIGSADVPDSLKGSNVCSLWCDEIAMMSEESYFQAVARVREPRAKRLCMYHTTTPDSMNWIYYNMIKKDRSDLEVFYSSTYENKALPSSYISSLESRYSKELQEMFLLGRFVDMTGKIINPKWFKYFNNEYSDKQSAIVHYAIDSAYGKENSDSTAILEYSIINNHAWLWDYHEVNMQFPDLVKYIEKIVKSHRLWHQSMIFIEPKASGISIVQQLKYTTMLNVVEDKPPTESKYSRVSSITGLLESGRVLLNPKVNWESFLFQMSQFSSEESFRDDLVDCLCIVASKLQVMEFDMSEVIIKDNFASGSPDQPRGDVLTF